MKRPRDASRVEAAATAGLSYADQLAALEARRRDADDILLRKMIQPRDPQRPG